jgi:hypothetical protein
LANPRERLVRGDVHQSAQAHGDHLQPFPVHGGIDRSAAPNDIPEGALRYAQNVSYPREIATPTTRPGLVRLSTGTAAPGALTNITAFQRSATVTETVYGCRNADGDDQELRYLDGSFASQLISDSLGALDVPSFRTINSRLVIAVKGQYQRTWDGEKGTDPAAAKASGTVTLSSNATEGYRQKIGAMEYTFWPDRVRPGDVVIGVDASTTAANLVAAIAMDSNDVTAEADGDEVTVTARRTGTSGNALVLEQSGALFTLSDVTLTGGVDGLALDTISTHGAPKPAFVISDKNRRLVAGGDPDQADNLCFCAPGNEWYWAAGNFLLGKVWPIGCGEGNSPAALGTFADEIWCHKSGQNREIYRIRIADPSPETWDLQYRPFSDVNAALNHRCAVTAGNKHIVLDRDYVGVYEGVDTYDEIRAGQDGNRIHDLIQGTVTDTAFMVLNPAELHVLIFPAAGRVALCYHYGTRRWTLWQFTGGVSLTCGVYHEGLRTVIFGAEDGHVYKLDPTVATDNGVPFATILIPRSFGDETMAQMTVKQVLLDYQSRIAGSGTIEIVADRRESAPKWVGDFSFESQDIFIADAIMEIAAATMEFAGNHYGRASADQQVDAEIIAPRVNLTNGAFVVNGLMVRLSIHGRAQG